MSDPDHENDQDSVIDFVHDSIVSDTNTECVLTGQLLAAHGAWVLGKGPNMRFDVGGCISRQLAQIAPCVTGNLDGVRHRLQPKFFAELLVGYRIETLCLCFLDRANVSRVFESAN